MFSVSEEDAAAAGELLLADEIEAAFTPDPDDEEPMPARRPLVFGLTRRQVLAAFGIVVLVWAGTFAHLFN